MHPPGFPSDPSPGPAALEGIELKIAFLVRANAELSDVVYRQQQEIQVLRTQLAAIASRLDSAQPGQTEYTPEQERPPHY